jgi:hypothetical protein
MNSLYHQQSLPVLVETIGYAFAIDYVIFDAKIIN